MYCTNVSCDCFCGGGTVYYCNDCLFFEWSNFSYCCYDIALVDQVGLYLLVFRHFDLNFNFCFDAISTVVSCSAKDINGTHLMCQ